ncbi:Hypothetical predicted protein [Paramuricea clavata]|uniref:Uncharacterized protein n=2 Tax=Paramuricea clavata TaxID=317549 RepID=A0A7D9IFJ5_PARCT|nr:Hypothetical predicted protein [Paramuricea clavata]
MALPTLEPYWMKHYKNKTEQFHVQRTQHESDFRNKWEENSRYFQRSNVEATKKRAWQSDQCFRESMGALDALYSKNTKKENLSERRKKLSELLLNEQKQLEVELRQHRSARGGQVQDMKTRAEDLKSAREERRQKLADEKLYEHWRQNAPELRQVSNTIF